MNIYPFIEAEKACRRNVKRACELLKVSRAAFYQHLAGPSARERADAELAAEIQCRARRVEGPLRRAAGARAAGPPRAPSRPQARRPAHARRPACSGRAAKRWKKTTIADPAAAARADRIRRDFTADAAAVNTRWCGDITYIAHVGGVAVPGHRHRHRLPPRRRLRDGRSPAHRAGRRRAGQRGRRPRPGAGSDLPHRQGLPVHLRRLRRPRGDCQVELSHGRTGQCWDNALAESFFGSIKGELIDLQPWPTRAGARRAVVEYIGWYNGTRLHSSLGYQTPAEFEASHHNEIKNVA